MKITPLRYFFKSCEIFHLSQERNSAKVSPICHTFVIGISILTHTDNDNNQTTLAYMLFF